MFTLLRNKSGVHTEDFSARELYSLRCLNVPTLTAMVIAGENVNMTVAECSGGICEHMDSRSSALAFVCDVAGGASPGEGESVWWLFRVTQVWA